MPLESWVEGNAGGGGVEERTRIPRLHVFTGIADSSDSQKSVVFAGYPYGG